ncbi:MAG: antirestriction protein ArdA [Pseudomonadota bacterium]
MTLTLHAQPYDISATGFYFSSIEEYDRQSKALKNSYGDPVEEFEIQFIDGDSIDCDLAKAIDISQANLAQYFACVDEWEEWEKIHVIIAVGECGYDFNADTQASDFDITIYEEDSYRDLAFRFVDEGLFGAVPESLVSYIDYDVIARDLEIEYSDTVINGERLIYSCG